MRIMVLLVASFFLLAGSVFATDKPGRRSEHKFSIEANYRVLNADIGKSTTARFIVRVPRHPDNRWLTIAWDSEDPGGEAGSSTQELRGASAPKIFDFNRFRFGHGRYVVVAEVTRADGSSVLTHTTILIQ